MRNINENTITPAVLESLADCPDPRLKEVLSALVRHLHDFAREVKLTEAEWMAGIQFLTATGQKCDDKRQEFILLSDTLGLSTLNVALNHAKSSQATEATVFGPFHVADAPQFELGDDISGGAAGEPLFVRATVRGPGGEPVADAVVDVWQADTEGLYDVQRADLASAQGRGVLRTDAEGRLHFRGVMPVAYPIPTDGPVGRMLDVTRRHPWRPAHVHFMIVAPGYETLITHVFSDGDRYLDSDAVFGVRSSLIGDFVRHPPGLAPDGSEQASDFHVLDFDFVLERAGTVGAGNGVR
ncbi:intradiol ring-cleavage dioxygenase [Variovorax robiniae]|uniref:Intradiol ring-cleavage dioxygenase n=1 Tax=Variovorax robiniae TaxID=1836199 RepID=A0ABU8XCP3_9BURK